jgi:non-homologous end joining protein Ku
MARGNAPTHTTATATLSLGMIAVPIAIYAATDDGLKVRRRQVTGPDAHEVGSKSYDKVTGDEVASTDIRKVFDTPNGAVELTDDEIVSVTAARPGVAEVVGFLPESVLTDGTYIPSGCTRSVPGWSARANPPSMTRSTERSR